MVGRLVSWWRGSVVISNIRLRLQERRERIGVSQYGPDQVVALAHEKWGFGTRVDRGQPTASRWSGSTAPENWLRVNVRTDGAPK